MKPIFTIRVLLQLLVVSSFMGLAAGMVFPAYAADIPLDRNSPEFDGDSWTIEIGRAIWTENFTPPTEITSQAQGDRKDG